MENLEDVAPKRNRQESASLLEMAQLAVRQGYLENRMKELRFRLDAGESPEPLREEFRKCMNESLAIGEKLAVHYRARERKLAGLEAKRRKAVKQAAMENAKEG